MTKAVFVDTNIFVYARDLNNKDKSDTCLGIVKELWNTRKGRISVQVQNELYVTLTQKLKPGLSKAEAWQELSDLQAWNPLPIHWNVLQTARSVQTNYKLSWWNSLMIATALLQDCEVFLSEDLQHGQEIESLTVQNPFR